jgi:nitrite reductase/ring-hydroxylating ferredoxin subunit
MANMLSWKSIPELSPGMLKNQPEAIHVFRLGSKKMAIARRDKDWVAFPSRCPHSGRPLDGGWLDDGAVVCPWYRFAFDLESGQCRNSGFAIQCYPVKIEAGQVWVGVRKKRWGIF